MRYSDMQEEIHVDIHTVIWVDNARTTGHTLTHYMQTDTPLLLGLVGVGVGVGVGL
jgi:hypothetical protein